MRLGNIDLQKISVWGKGAALPAARRSPQVILVEMLNNLRHGTRTDGVRLYCSQLELLEALGVLARNKRLFNVLSGVDLFPGYFVDEMLTYDRRIRKIDVPSFFLFLLGAVQEFILAKNILQNLPSTADLSEGCKITHNDSTVLGENFLDDIKRKARPGDVIFLRFSVEFLLTWHIYETYQIKEWFDRLLAVVPSGVYFVVFGYLPETPLLYFPEGVAAYMLQSGPFDDMAQTLLSSTEQVLLKEVNATGVSQSVPKFFPVHVDKSRDFSFALGGALSILQKR